MTTKFRTKNSKSPVLFFDEDGYILGVALTHEGDIYRLLKWNEEPEYCDEFEINLTLKTLVLISDWRKHRICSSPFLLKKLDTIQQFETTIGYSRISDVPLFKLDIAQYYAAKSALEWRTTAENYREKEIAAFARIKSLNEQVRILQAKLKVSAKMKEKNCNEKQALAYILGGKRYESELARLFDAKIIYPNRYTGSGKWSSKGADHAVSISKILSLAHISHTTGNDAPKGGFSGNFIKIK